MKRILLVDLAERELKKRTELRGEIAKTSSPKTPPAEAHEKPVRGKKKSAAKAPAKQSIDSGFTRRLR